MQYLLVDGHSIIFQWPDLRAIHRQRGGAARDELVRRLTQYQDSTGIHVVAVFDGQGEKKASEESEPGGIQIFYSGRRMTADSIIEQLCARYAKEHEIVVATDDHMERQTAITFGASTISSEMLRSMLEDADRDLQRRIAERRKR